MSVDLSPEERAKLVAERADVKYGPFASLHEAYGVLAEELWEMGQVPGCLHSFNDIHHMACGILHRDDIKAFVRLAELLAIGCTEEIKHGKAPEAWKNEAIDVIAVCDRIIAQWGEKS